MGLREFGVGSVGSVGEPGAFDGLHGERPRATDAAEAGKMLGFETLSLLFVESSSTGQRRSGRK